MSGKICKLKLALGKMAEQKKSMRNIGNLKIKSCLFPRQTVAEGDAGGGGRAT